ncbi:hypothetical protein ANTRET_LOCUS4338 [Anthophora retusa]
MGHQAVYRGEKDTVGVQRESIHLNGDLQRISALCLPQRLHVVLAVASQSGFIVRDIFLSHPTNGDVAALPHIR